jgi:hypothetical protein
MDDGESWRRVAREEEGESARKSDACNFSESVYVRGGEVRAK